MEEEQQPQQKEEEEEEERETTKEEQNPSEANGGRETETVQQTDIVNNTRSKTSGNDKANGRQSEATKTAAAGSGSALADATVNKKGRDAEDKEGEREEDKDSIQSEDEVCPLRMKETLFFCVTYCFSPFFLLSSLSPSFPSSYIYSWITTVPS